MEEALDEYPEDAVGGLRKSVSLAKLLISASGLAWMKLQRAPKGQNPTVEKSLQACVLCLGCLSMWRSSALAWAYVHCSPNGQCISSIW